MVILKDVDGHHAILKHCSFPDKIKPVRVKSLAIGTPYRAKFMTSNPKVGRKVLQYCEGLGGRQFKCFGLSSQAVRQPGKASPFDEKDDDEIDAGFDYILTSNVGPALPLRMLSFVGKPKPSENQIRPFVDGPVA